MESQQGLNISSNFHYESFSSWEDFPLIPSLKFQTKKASETLSPSFQFGLMPVLQNFSFYLTAPPGTQRSSVSMLGILNNLNLSLNKLQAIVVLPTKLLLDEYLKTLESYNLGLDFKVIKCTGGDFINKKELQKSQIGLFTPGKLLSLMGSKTIDISKVSHVVFDIANKLFQGDMKTQADKVLSAFSDSITYWFLSPIPDEVAKTSFLLKVPDGKTMEITDNRALQLRFLYKIYDTGDEIFDYILRRCEANLNQIVIFTSNSDELNRILEHLQGFQPAFLDDSLGLDEILEKREVFKRGACRVLVCNGSFHLARKVMSQQPVEVFNLDLPDANLLQARARRGSFNALDKIFLFFKEYERDQIDEIQNNVGIKLEDADS